MDIRVIKNKSDYEKALKCLSDLMDLNPTHGSKKENDLEILILVIKDYEQKVCFPVVPDPVDAIKFRMDQMEYSRKDLIPFLGSISRVSEILSRRRGLSLSMIRKLHEGLGIPLESLIVKRLKRRTRIRTKKVVKKFRISRVRRKKIPR